MWKTAIKEDAMKTIQINFTPLEPYFFGNDKIFSFGKDNKNAYYIQSETLPSQSTVFGAVRYLFLPHKNFPDNADKVARNIEAIGKFSFNIESDNVDFGKIVSMSNIFITKDNRKYIIAPMDAPGDVDIYSPFEEYLFMNTIDGEKIYIPKYNSKKGFIKAIVSTDCKETIPFDKLFSDEIRIGINRKNDNDGFFKRKYVRMKAGYSFSVYACVEDDAEITCDKVYMGQGKSVFSVSYKEIDNEIDNEIELFLANSHIGIDLKGKSLVYFASDSFVEPSVYDKVLFAATETRDYRSFTTVKRTISKSENLYKLIKAGCIFIIDNSVKKDIETALQNNIAQTAGFNKYYIKEY